MLAGRLMRLLVVCLVGLGLLLQPVLASVSACQGSDRADRACCGCCAAKVETTAPSKRACCRKREAPPVRENRSCCQRRGATDAERLLSVSQGLRNCCCSGAPDAPAQAPLGGRTLGAERSAFALLAELPSLAVVAGPEDCPALLGGRAPPPLSGRALLLRLCVWRI